MADDARDRLHHALEDLGQGIRALLGLDSSRPSLVRELLSAPESDPPGRPAGRVRPPRPMRGAPPARRRGRRSSRATLALVE